MRIFDGAMFPTGAQPLYAQHPNLPAGFSWRNNGSDCGDDGRDSWANVTPPTEPDFGRVSLIDASSFDDTKAYVSPRLAMLDDFRQRIWKAEDFGQSCLRHAAAAVEADTYQVRNRSNRGSLSFPIKVHYRLANLLSLSERGDGRPGSGKYAVVGIMEQLLLRHLSSIQAVREDELVAVNAEQKRLALEEIVPDEVDMRVVS